MTLIYQTNKRSGITYAYEAEYLRDKEKQQSPSKRRLVSLVDTKTGEVIPTDGRMRKSKDPVEKLVKMHG